MSDEGSSSYKRQRIGLACDPCRKRKSKCGGEQPVCLVCQSTSRQCSYTNAVRRRGLQSGYVRGLEILLAVFIRQSPSDEVALRNILRDKTRAAGIFGFDDAEMITEIWHKSGLAKDLDSLLAISEESLQTLLCRTDDRSQLDDALSPLRKSASSQTGPRQRPVTVVTSQISNPTSSNPQPSEPVSTISLGLSSPSAIGWMLPKDTIDHVEHYLTYTQCWLPILERHDILRSVYLEGAKVVRRGEDDADRLLLWAVIAFNNASKESNLENRSGPIPEEIAAFVHDQALNTENSIKLAHVQALLILVLLHVVRGQITNAWMLAAKCVRMVTLIDKEPYHSNKRFEHTFRACVLLDCIISGFLNQLPVLPSGYSDRVSSLDMESLEEWEPWKCPSSSTFAQSHPMRCISTFNLLGGMMELLTQVLHEFPTHEASRQLMSDINKWRATMPQDREISESSGLDPPIIFLHLSWNFLLSTLLMRSKTLAMEMRDLIKTTAVSSEKLLRAYIGLTAMAGVSPLLTLYTIQTQRSMLQVDLQGTEIEMCLSDVLCELESHAVPAVAREVHGADSGHVDSRQQRNILQGGQEADTSRSGRDRFETRRGSHSSVIDSALLSLTDTTGQRSSLIQFASQLSEDRQSRGTFLIGDQLGIETPIDENDFDMLFQDFVASDATKRTEQDPMFAQNLGFVSSDFDADLLRFLEEAQSTDIS